MKKRTHLCGTIRKAHIGMEATLKGWVQRRRDLGGVIFIDLRDKSGICQVVFDLANMSKEDFAVAEHLRNEYVIEISGLIEERSEDTINAAIPTGEVDVRAKRLTIYSEAKNTPFRVGESSHIKEELRLKYRYLDLRAPEMLQHLMLRQTITTSVRSYLQSIGCLEVETPILTKSTPEGARDFLVPSRLSKGQFYALPQSPQIYKQLLMVSGVDRYFQVAKCFRDEDLRADRQLEFTQVDMEFSFVDAEDIIEILEELFQKIMQETKGIKIDLPMRRMTYREAMECYGFDKPDLRFGMPMVDLTDFMAEVNFSVFSKVLHSGGIIKALNVPGGQSFTRSQIEYLTERAVFHGGNGMAWIALDETGAPQSILTKYFTEEQMRDLISMMEAKPGDLILFSADSPEKARYVLGSLRLDIGDLMGLRKKDHFAFVVVTEFPLFEYDQAARRYVAMHHPFTSPVDEDKPLFETSPDQMRAKAYDIVLNGIELGSGSIRIHDRDLQAKMFETLGFSDRQIESRFGFMLNAFEYGVPPHGGFAFGLDRLVMMLAGVDSIREVIAFPKMRDGSCAMMDAPSEVDPDQLEELSIYLHSAYESEKKKQAMDLSVIEYVSDLAKIALTTAEKISFTSDLESIIAFADQMAAMDLMAMTAGDIVETGSNRFRADVPVKAITLSDALKNAPEVQADCFFVPKTVE